MNRRFLLLSLLALAFPVLAEVQTKTVEYRHQDTTMVGYLAWDDARGGKRPGVLVVHEWWGHNEYARKRAEMLAGLGYVALAVDMYGGGKLAEHPREAGAFAGAVRENMETAQARFLAAMALLQQQPQSDGRMGAIGYCFGGGIVLEMARRGVDLDGVASFHGSLATEQPAQVGQVKARVMVAHGADDPFVKPEQLQAFHEEMRAAEVQYQFISYPGVKHSFTNPQADEFGSRFGLPLDYDAAADADSWAAMQGFFERVFR